MAIPASFAKYEIMLTTVNTHHNKRNAKVQSQIDKYEYN